MLIVAMVLLLWHHIVLLWCQDIISIKQTIVQFDKTIVFPRNLATGSIYDYLFCYCPLVGILFEVLRIVVDGKSDHIHEFTPWNNSHGLTTPKTSFSSVKFDRENTIPCLHTVGKHCNINNKHCYCLLCWPQTMPSPSVITWEDVTISSCWSVIHCDVNFY